MNEKQIQYAIVYLLAEYGKDMFRIAGHIINRFKLCISKCEYEFETHLDDKTAQKVIELFARIVEVHPELKAFDDVELRYCGQTESGMVKFAIVNPKVLVC